MLPNIQHFSLYTLFCISFSLSFSLSLSVCVRASCHFADWLWKHCSNSSLLWRGSPYLLLLSLCLWELAAAHWRSYMTVKRAINAGREAEVYGCFSLAIVRPCLRASFTARWNSVPNYGTSSPLPQQRGHKSCLRVWGICTIGVQCNKPSETQGY